MVTIHSAEEMDEDDLSIFDVERVILTGNIIEKQKDQHVAEWKYLIQGQTLDGATATVVVKMGPTGKLIIITVFRE